ncbi:SemiSWEET family sugar transporter [Spiroplasma endosymbiont of Virgichneumon dumeticola]|uniref:SemiSWEET family sugar transporter n=1 Tax=Spiroplasma endosymbiont of Virgichneumon dumeticola TaxID=3139323 RepID=UPI0035C8A8A8
MEIFIQIIGYLAGILAVITFIPQAIKTIKTKETKHITLLTYIIYNIANSFFLLFGVLSIALPVMWAPGATTLSIVLWGSTLILPYTATIIATNCIYVKVKNMKTLGEKAGTLEVNS